MPLKKRKLAYYITALILIFLLLLVAYKQMISLRNQPIENVDTKATLIDDFYKVTKVIDGDTIILEDGRKIRLLGIDAPERGYPYYNKSKSYLSYLVLDKKVQLESDLVDKDEYDRFLRYVYVDSNFVNEQLVKEGLANAFIISDLKYEEQLIEAEYYARENEFGMWKINATQAAKIYIIDFHFDAYGNDEYNLNDEYITFGNRGDDPMNLTGWTIKDDTDTVFEFPIYILQPKGKVTIHTGIGINRKDTLYWNSQTPIWGNKGDVLHLRNRDGDLVILHEY